MKVFARTPVGSRSPPTEPTSRCKTCQANDWEAGSDAHLGIEATLGRKEGVNVKLGPVQSPICGVRFQYGDLAGPSAGRRLCSSPEVLVNSKKSRIMTRVRGVQRVATAALVVAALASCASNGNDPAANPSPSPRSPAPTTSSTSPPSESDIASEGASAILRKYFATVDALRQDPKRPASDLDAVASSTDLLAQRNLLKSQRAGGLHQVGATKIVELSVQSVSLDNPATALIDVCWDVTAVDVLDSDGSSVVTSERKDVGWTRFTVTNAKWETAPADGWRVSGGSDLEKAPCAAS